MGDAASFGTGPAPPLTGATDPPPTRLGRMPPRTDTPDRVPWLSRLLGYGPVAVFPALAILYAADRPAWVAWSAQLWGAAILIFLAGVARGLSFFTDGGPRVPQLAAMALRFWPGLIALLLPARPALLLLALGYAGVAVLDVPLARSGGAPRYFAHLRPPQMLVAVAGLLGLALLLR